MRRLFLFLIAGAAGFAVDLGALSALISAGADPYSARAVSFLLAVVTTYLINATQTFRARDRIGIGSFLLYIAASLGGLATNLIVYVAAVANGLSPQIALAIASAAALTVNFFGYGKVFARRR